MKTYLVGGAVRDELLGRPVADRDYVVVGATPAAMRSHGFAQVGRDFPVFLHPRTGEHHALARTERKTGPGHAGFVCMSSAEVTLAEDLGRRDLTINAMARAEDGTLVDLHGGQADLAARRLRHISAAFAEDPLRVFRVARFAAELPGFRVVDETLALMRRMRPELPSLPGERVWQELARAVAAPAPGRFFEVVQRLGGGFWLAELDLPATTALFAGCSFQNAQAGLAGLGWVNAQAAVDEVFERLRAPRLLRRAVGAVSRHGHAFAAADPSPATLLDALAQVGAFRQGPLPQLVLDAVEVCAGVNLAPLRQLVAALRRERVRGTYGRDYGHALRGRRLQRIASAMPLRGA